MRYDRWRLSLRHIQDGADVSIVLGSELRATFGVPTIDFSDPSYDNEFTAATLLMAVAANAARTRLVLAQPGGIVSQYSTRKCSNPRDHVYAVIALFTPGVLAERYTVDYSLTVQEVFIRFASHCLRVIKDTTLLSVARSQVCCRDTAFMSEVAGRGWTSYLPSWCPDWAGPDCPVKQLVTHEEATAGRVIWNASSDTEVKWLSTSCPVLGLRGISICRIQYYTEQFNHYSRKAPNRLADMEHTVMKLTTSMSPHAISLDYIDVLLDGGTLGTDEVLRGLLPCAVGDSIANADVRARLGAVWLRAHAKQLFAASSFSRRGTGRRSKSRALPGSLLLLSSSNHSGRRLFMTCDARLGTGPEGLEIGDVICVLLGVRVPFVLRPQPDKMHHALIGEAHVPGLMRGEGLEMGKLKRDILLV